MIFVTFTRLTYIARASPWFSSRLTYIGRGIFNKTLQQNNPKIQSIHHFKTFYYGKWKKKKYMYIRKKFWNRRMDWILGFLPFTSTRYTQNTGFQRTFVIFDPSKFSKITHFDPSRGRKLYFGHFRSIKCLSQARKKVKSRDFRGFYMTSLISRQSAVGEITYISGIVYDFDWFERALGRFAPVTAANPLSFWSQIDIPNPLYLFKLERDRRIDPQKPYPQKSDHR